MTPVPLSGVVSGHNPAAITRSQLRERGQVGIGERMLVQCRP
jgi:hypothetical protein